MTNLNQGALDAYSIQDYSPVPMIEGVEIVNLRRFNDDGGAMTELARFGGATDGGSQEENACPAMYFSLGYQSGAQCAGLGIRRVHFLVVALGASGQVDFEGV